MVVSTANSITDTLNSYTSKPNGIPGAVFRAVKRDGSILYDGASGVRGLEAKEPMTSDAVFWIASQTKLITAVAAMQLIEQEKISVNDYAEKYLPEIGEIPILLSFEGEKPILKKPSNKIVVRQLLTHTSGLNYEFNNPNTLKYKQINNIPGIMQAKRITVSNPLGFEPGTAWDYGTGMDWIGLIIEKVTGQQLGAYMEQHIFAPLGMKTTFITTDAQNARHAHMHARAADGTIAETSLNYASGKDVELHEGGAGAHSDAADFTALLHALLNDGVGANGTRILKKESVDLLFADQTTDAGINLELTLKSTMPELTNDFPIFPGIPKAWTFGGIQLNVDLPTGRSSGSLSWAGLPNCYWWIDRTKGVAGVILSQLLPFADAQVLQCMAECEALIYKAI